MNSLVTWQNILTLTEQYLELVLVASTFSICIGLVIGISVTRNSLRSIAPLALGAVNVCQSIPTLAVLALVMGFLGIGFKPAVFALFIYSLLPVVQNTMIGLIRIEPGILEAARAMGMSRMKVLISIELPLAASVIMSGIRTAVTVNIGTATLGALIGAGGLGNLVFTGLSMEEISVMLAGAIPIAILAIIADIGLEVVGKRLDVAR
ncbi:MAG: ABC transporter permease [Alicyclobacillus sp.]|nr:ABC transporter permease [Alicyclobacillus sp.]